jgi:hypothetical protein
LSIRTVIVDLESIHTPEIPAVANSLLESLANSIVKLRGLLHLPIIYQVGIDEYEMISGQTEFYAYLQARKFDESLPDRLDAVLVDKKNEADVQKLLSTTGVIEPSPDSTLIAISNLDAKLERLLNVQNKSLFDQYALAINNLDVKFDQLSINQKDLLIQLKKSPSQTTSGDDSSQMISLLAAFNRITEKEIGDKISLKLKPMGKDKVAKIRKILETAKKPDEVFDSLRDVQKVIANEQSGLLGEAGMLKAVDLWHQ